MVSLSQNLVLIVHHVSQLSRPLFKSLHEHKRFQTTGYRYIKGSYLPSSGGPLIIKECSLTTWLKGINKSSCSSASLSKCNLLSSLYPCTQSSLSAILVLPSQKVTRYKNSKQFPHGCEFPKRREF